MIINEIFSHLNGLEYLTMHLPDVLDEIKSVITEVDAAKCKTKVSKEKTKKGSILYSPVDLNKAFKEEFSQLNWKESRTQYYVTSDIHLARETLAFTADAQKRIIELNGKTPICSFIHENFVKNRVAIEIQFGKYSFVAYDLFVKHMAFYVGDKIDVGVEILPMKSLSAQMSSGIAYYEGEVYNVIRQGRNTPAVPLIIMGIAP